MTAAVPGPAPDGAEILAVPSGTTLRFGTLVAVAIASTMFVYVQLGAILPRLTVLHDSTCQVRAGLYLTHTGIGDPDEAKWAAYHRCMADVLLPRLGWLVAGLLLLAGVAAAVYYGRPGWRIRRSGLLRLDEMEPLWTRLRDPLAELAERAGVRRAPTYLLDPSSPCAGGVAFGRRRRPLVCLDAGLVALLDRDRPAFDAVVLHELAHVRSHDVATTYATLAVWRSFLAVSIVPYVLVFLVDPWLLSAQPLRLPVVVPLTGWPGWGTAIRLAAMLGLAYLARTAVLRSREHYADALVATWTGRTDPYASLAPEARRRVPGWLATHPSRPARDAAMRDPRSLLRPGFGETLLAGLAAVLAWSQFTYALGTVGWYRSGNPSFTIMRVVLGVVAGALVCVLARRGAAYLRAGGTGRAVFARPGFALGAGLALGMLLTLSEGRRLSYALSPARIAASVLVVAGSTLVCVWAGYCARLLGPEVRGRRGLAVAGGVVLVCVGGLGWFADGAAAQQVWDGLVRPVAGYAAGLGFGAVDRPIVTAVVLVFVFNTHRLVTAAAMAALWAVPLLLATGAGGRLRYGLLAGAAGAAGWALPLATLRILDDGPVDAAHALVQTAWELAAAMVAQLVVAGVVVRRADGVTAAVAVWVLGLCAGAGVWIAHWHHGHVDSVLATRPLQVLPLTGTAAVLVALVARRRPEPELRPRRATRSATIAAGGLLAVSAAAMTWWPAAPGAVPLLPAPAATSFDPDDAANTWTYGGGWDTAVALNEARSAAVQSFTTGDRPTIGASCAKLQAAVRVAAAFPLPPQEQLRATWTAELEDTAIAADECVRIMRSGEGSDLMVAKFKSAIAYASRLIEQIEQVRRRTIGL